MEVALRRGDHNLEGVESAGGTCSPKATSRPRSNKPPHACPKDPSADKSHNFDKNKDHVRYAHYQQQGLFIGSGVIDAACKSLIGKRLKQSAMQWTVRGANAIIALRCATLSIQFQDYWDQQAA